MLHARTASSIAATFAALASLAACGEARRPTVSAAAAASSCTGCHGDANPAPPLGTHGETATSARAVGAHQAHLGGGGIARPVACGECHVVPTRTFDAAHPDGVVQVRFGPLAAAGGVAAAWDPVSATCATWCHGAALAGGAVARPIWTRVDGTQAACGACHGLPPPAPHPAVSGGAPACGACHPGTVLASGAIDVAGGLHVNGAVEVIGGGSCTACHGDPTRQPEIAPAPPAGTRGETATTAIAVGAHQAHLAARLSAPVACGECHQLPGTGAQHPDGTVQVQFGSLARTGSLAPAWDRATAGCAASYCHGGTLQGGGATRPIWTRVDGSQKTCASCHGAPPPTGRHQQSEHLRSCGDCHGSGYSGATVAAATHVDGVVQLGNRITSFDPGSLRCTNTCHGAETWR